MILPEISQDQHKYHALGIAVDDHISLSLQQLEPPSLREAASHGVEGGKRVRPLVTLAMCGAVGGDEADALSVAAAIELLHTSSLIHDDIMDNADMRRGNPTVHAKFGVPTAILTGDTLIAVAFRLVHRTQMRNKNRVMDAFTNAFLHVCEGQGYDMWLSGKEFVAPETHKTMVEKKTARLLEASAAIGAMVGTDEDAIIRGAGLFGYHLGMAFQAHDDLLDVTGDMVAMGKPVHADAKNGKATYLTLAYPQTDAAPDAGLRRISRTRRLINHHTDIACTFLDTLLPTPAREFLGNLALSLVERKS